MQDINSSSNDDAMNGGLKVIQPSPLQDSEALQVLQCLNRRLETHKRRFMERISEGDISVRRIQGWRLEVFCSSTFKPSSAFDELCEQLSQEDDPSLQHLSAQGIKECILRFAVQQAAKDTRFPSKNYAYNNFSLLVTYDAVDAQGPHIDSLFPNAQFGLLLTDASPGTITYQVANHIQTAQDLKKHVPSWKNAPKGLLQAMSDEEIGVPELLRSFGNTLQTQIKAIKTPLLHCGDCTSLPGSVLHAGPSCSKFRAILFSSAWPTTPSGGTATPVAEYDPDTQYFGALLLADIIPAIWPRLSEPDRVFLLERLADYMALAKKYHIRNVHAHVDAQHFCYDVLHALEYQTYRKDKLTKEEYICAQVKTQRTILLPPMVRGVALPLSMLLKISLPKLTTTYDENGSKCQISIYKDLRNNVDVDADADADAADSELEQLRVSRGVLIHYHLDGAWEGCDGNYTLEMHASAGVEELFDGSNGVLKDGDGEVIHCCMPGGAKRKRAT